MSDPKEPRGMERFVDDGSQYQIVHLNREFDPREHLEEDMVTPDLLPQAGEEEDAEA